MAVQTPLSQTLNALTQTVSTLKQTVGVLEQTVGKLTESYDALHDFVFGHEDKRTNKKIPGLRDRVDANDRWLKIGVALIGIVALHYLGIPTNAIGQAVLHYFGVTAVQ